MSQSPDEYGQAGRNGPSRPSEQPGSAQPKPNGQGRRPADPVADFQRWLMRAGARSLANQVADQVRRTIGQERRSRGDVWDTAVNEAPPEESPECQWCPVCQAARAARLGGPGLISSLGNAGGALAAMAQDAFSAFEQVMKAQEQNRSAERPMPSRPQETRPSSSWGQARPASAWTSATTEPQLAPPSSAAPQSPAGADNPGSADSSSETGPPETAP